MANYNYYDKLQKKFNNEKKYNMGVFDKPTYNGYNENAEWDKSLYEYNPNHRHSERNEVETKNPEIPRQARNDNVGQGNAFPYKPLTLRQM